MEPIHTLISQYPISGLPLAFVLGLLLMPLVIRIARKNNLVVKPNKRTSHNGVIPNIGGLDIFAALIIVYVLFLYDSWTLYVLVGFCIIFLIGFLDDLIDLTPFWKVVGETLAALFLIYFADIRIESLYGIFGIEELSCLSSYLISYVVFLAIVNALNLIDGVDGLASGLGILSCLFYGVYFTLSGENDVAMLCFSTVGALIVFFIYNVFGGTQRKIFMGDSGALLLGYLLVFFTFRFLADNLGEKSESLYFMNAAPVVAICAMFVPLFDTVRVMLTRLKQRRPLFAPDKNHIHHLLLSIGLSHRQVTALLMLVSLVFMGLGILGRNWPNWLLLIAACLLGSTLVFVLWRIIDAKRKKREKEAM